MPYYTYFDADEQTIIDGDWVTSFWYANNEDIPIWVIGDQTDDNFGPPSGHTDNSVAGTVLNGNYPVTGTGSPASRVRTGELNTPWFTMQAGSKPVVNFWMDIETPDADYYGALYIKVNGAGTWTEINGADFTIGAPNNGNHWDGDQPSGEWQEVELGDLYNLRICFY